MKFELQGIIIQNKILHLQSRFQCTGNIESQAEK